MSTRFAIPFVILAVLFLPLPFILSFFVSSVLLAVRTRGEPFPEFAVVSFVTGPPLLRSPPH
jgi:hypothetical protein